MSNPKKKALNLLQKRPKTEYEMRSALKKAGFSQEDIDETIDYLEEMNYINDVNYAGDFVEMSMAKKRGPWRISRELKSRGVEKFIIEDAIAEAIDSQWERDTAELIVREIKAKNPSLNKDKLLAKVVNKLTYEGFSDDVITGIAGEFYK